MSYVRDFLNDKLTELQRDYGRMEEELLALKTSLETNKATQDAIEYVLNGENVK